MGSPWRTEKMNPNEPFIALAVTQEHVLLQCFVIPCQKQDRRLEFNLPSLQDDERRYGNNQ